MASAIIPTLRTKDFLSVLDLNHDELDQVMDLAAAFKQDRTAGRTGGAEPGAGVQG